MATFSTNELLRQSERVSTESSQIQITSNEMKGFCEFIANTVKSEDSNLSAEWDNMASAFNQLGKVIDDNCKKLSDALNKYATSTQQNEQEAATKTQTTSSEVNDLASQIASLGN